MQLGRIVELVRALIEEGGWFGLVRSINEGLVVLVKKEGAGGTILQVLGGKWRTMNSDWGWDLTRLTLVDRLTQGY